MCWCIKNINAVHYKCHIELKILFTEKYYITPCICADSYRDMSLPWTTFLLSVVSINMAHRISNAKLPIFYKGICCNVRYNLKIFYTIKRSQNSHNIYNINYIFWEPKCLTPVLYSEYKTWTIFLYQLDLLQEIP